MAEYSTAEVRNLTLQHLGILPEGETPSAANAEVAEMAIDSVHARLETEGLLAWPVCHVPGAVLFAVSYLAALELTDLFGSSADQVQRIMAGAERGMIDIRKHSTVANSGRTRALYY